MPKVGRRYSTSRDPLSPAPAVQGKVLLVEDDLAVLTATARMLSRRGYQTVAIREPSQAMIELGRHPEFTCAVVDAQLGEVSGLELVRWIRIMHPRIHIVLATGDPPPRRPPAGVVFVEKPVDVRELLEAIQKGCPPEFPNPVSWRWEGAAPGSGPLRY